MWFDESREIKLIELGKNGFNKAVKIRVENIARLKQMLILDENNYCWQMGGYIVHDIAGCLNIIYKCFVKCEVIYE
jgi:hypothetical protein